ncbi:uncharacterized protein BO66DRAFT_191744 [Aspergillus aculeatinus CBS 121060]|uniref:Uncharacterized protein n=1 Tax=Aspergillus aculeatinus CBS 121060 TaxID=1448322 RepID=A0ACD1GXP1_9EURO|nr:hypothetical protein BO66DRAFT_191744 [Aspergillus aculeatinus CBS 121060]RAH65959.1 hypothetical protein BO66DRAFT_191744 [Aspergillus aculeatinus CBS 121060]
MESARGRRKAPPASLDMSGTKLFQPAISVVKERQSATTDFYDTDFEYSDTDEESPRRSMGSFGYDSVSSASTPELPTPENDDRQPFSFRRDSTKGPSGPHLFRTSMASATSVPSTEIDLYFERSPNQSHFQSDVETPQFPLSTAATPHIVVSAIPTPNYPASEQAAVSARFPPSEQSLPSARYPPSEQSLPSSRFAPSEQSLPSSRFAPSEQSMPSARYPPSEQSLASSKFASTEDSLPSSRFAPSEQSLPSARYAPSEDSMLSARYAPSEQYVSSEQYTTSERYVDSAQHTSMSTESTQFAPSNVPTSNKILFSPCTPQAFMTVHPDVSQVDEYEIRNWSPSQVAHWMHIGGYDGSVIEKFMINDISGNVLLNLQIDDLKELDIQSFGKRHQLMASINHLRDTMLRRPASGGRQSPDRRSYALTVSPTGEVVTHGPPHGNQLTEAEAVSIVGIEQVLPKPHNCSKGENCPKYRRYMRQMEKLSAEYPGAMLVPGGRIVTGNPGNPETAANMLRPRSDAEPSVVASSDVLGPQPTPRLSEEALSGVQKLDPHEKMRQYFSYQHIDPPSGSDSEPEMYPEEDTPDEAAPVMPPPPPRTNNMTANLRNLPKLQIPTDYDSDDITTAVTTQRTITPSMAKGAYGSPTAVQQYGPFSNARQMQSVECLRRGTPFTEVDVPVTAEPVGPIARETSQSVPPDMRYGNLMQQQRYRSATRSPAVHRQASMSLRRVKENKPLTPIEDPSDLRRSPRIGHKLGNNTMVASVDPDVTRSGYMKKRMPARFLRHDWHEAHFTLRGTNLEMHRDELAALRHSKALEEIDVDEYAVACSSLASSSKLTAALKKSILRSGNNLKGEDAAFNFSLVPASKEGQKKMLFGSKDVKPHHFAVKTRDERIDWMRDMMLAKALKKGRDEGYEVRPEGNFI